MRDSRRKDADGPGSLVFVPVALLAALISAFWAWKLASGQFVPTPIISDPGRLSESPKLISVRKAYVFLVK